MGRGITGAEALRWKGAWDVEEQKRGCVVGGNREQIHGEVRSVIRRQMMLDPLDSGKHVGFYPGALINTVENL
jgi:hypothetical protein